jgi:hypothetical protein
VLDLTRFLAVPFCTTILADLGADVVKVEAPKGGDEGRYGYPPVDGVPVFFLALNRGKKGVTLDLRQDEGRAILRRLLPHFDVLVENFAGGTLARWGLAPADLSRAPGAYRREPFGIRADGAVVGSPVVRHHHAGGERLHVAHGISRQSADAGRRLAGRLRRGAVRRHRGAGGALCPRADGSRTGDRRLEPGCHVLALDGWPGSVAAGQRPERQPHLSTASHDSASRDGWW